MVSWILPFGVALVTGILSSWGVGGGTLLLVCMTLFLDVGQREAQAVNLLFFLPTAAIGLFFHRKNGFLDKEVWRQSAVPGALASLAGALIATAVDVSLLRRPFGLFLLYTGLRPGESMALDIGDIHDGLIDVSKAIDGRTNDVKIPKSRAGIRSVPIPQPLKLLLPREGSLPPNRPLFTQFDRTREHQPTARRHTKRSLRCLWNSLTLAMQNVEKEMIANKEISRASEHLPPITPYDLRHTYCTDLAKSGVPLVTASKLMGHSSVNLTARIYTHVDQEMTLIAAARLDAFYCSAGDAVGDTPETV